MAALSCGAQDAVNVDDVTLDNLRSYGNKGERATYLWQCEGNRDFAKNVLLTGNRFLVTNDRR